MTLSRHFLALAAAVCAWLLPTALMAEQDHARAVRDAVAVARELRQSENVYDQIAGAGTLVDIGDRESLEFLSATIQHPDYTLQRSAIDMLLNVQHPSGVDLIYRYAALDSDPTFMKFLAESLAARPREDMAEFLMGSLELEDLWVRKYALQALAEVHIDDGQKQRIARYAEDEKEDGAIRAYAWYVLMHAGSHEESLERLLGVAVNGGPGAKEAAAVGLGLVANADTRAMLKHLREDPVERVKMAAMTSEAGFGEGDAIAKVIHAIAYGKGLTPSVAAAGVRRMPTAVAVEITEKLLACCDLKSESAARLLESWASIDADPAHVYAWGLEHRNPDVRMQSAWLVGMRQDRAWLDAIIPMLKDSDPGIRGMAAWAIVRIAGDEYDPGVEI